MLKSRSIWLILVGLLAIIAGILALAWPRVTILTLVTLFAIFAFIGAGQQASRSYRSATAGPVFGHLLLALIDLAAGVVALLWPGPTALVLVLVAAVWALVAGFTEFFIACGSGETAGTRPAHRAGRYPNAAAIAPGTRRGPGNRRIPRS